MENKTSINPIPTTVDPKINQDAGVTLIVIPPDGGWGWVILTASFFINFIMDGTIYSLGLFLDEISIYMNTYPTRVAYAGSIMLGVNLLTAPIICGLTNKYGFRIITFSGGIMAAIVLLISSFIKDLTLFLLIYGVLGGFACALIYVPSIVILGFYFEKWRALASAIGVCGSSFGIIFYPLILNNALAGYEWTEKFRILSTSFLFVSIFSLTFKPLNSVNIQLKPEQDESILTVFLGGDYVPTQIISKIRNIHSTTTEIQEVIPHFENIKKDPSSSSTLVAASGFPDGSGSGTLISRMSTINEVDIKLSKKERFLECWKKLWSFEWCRYKKIHTTLSATISRPMYRDDIFFTGSIYTLPEYTKKPSDKGIASSKMGIDYHISVTRVATRKDLEEETKKFVCCPEALKRIITTMLDFNLLKSPSFLCLSISGFLVSLGMYVPFVYIIQKAVQNNIEKETAVMMVTGLGIANLFGRILSGVLASIPKVNALVVNYIGLFVAGIPTILFAFATDLWMYYIYIALYGSFIAVVPSMKTIILVDLLGLDKLTNAFGITLMFHGVASFIGIPIAGYFIECTNSYSASFIYCGCTTILSGLILIPIKFIKKLEKKKLNV